MENGQETVVEKESQDEVMVVDKVNDEKPAKEIINNDKPAEEKVNNDKSADEKVNDDKSAEEKVNDDKSAEEKNNDAKPAEENINDDKSADIKAETEKKEEPTAELLQKIKNQVEYYFGDVNMQRDKYLIGQTALDDGWVPMSVMLNFKMLASMSKDIDVILKALESSELMEISEDKKKIRRSLKHPLPVFNEEYRKAQEARTVYMKGFPLQNTDIEKLKTYFAQYEPFENIVLRKYQDKDKRLLFKGSVFVQFKALDDAKAFMARESVKYGETELIRKWSADYIAEKTKEKEERRQKKAEDKAKKGGNVNKDEADNDEQEGKNGLPKGSVLHFTDMPEGSTREHLKESLGALNANVAYVEFNKGDAEAWVRLQGESAAQPIFDQMKDGKIKIMDKDIQCRVIEGEEEETYLTKAKGEINNLRQKFTKGKRRGRKGQTMPRNMKKRRHSSSQDNPPSSKKVAVE